VYCSNNFYDKIYDLEEDVYNFIPVKKSVTMKEDDFNVVGIWKIDVISIYETLRLYCMALVLERFEKETLCGKKVKGI